MMIQHRTPSSDRIGTQSGVMGAAVLAILLGAFLVIGTGFAHSNAIHNAAHDSRHAFAFPCH